MELIGVLYELYEQRTLQEAKKWIEVAEKKDIYPAKIAFLKGLILRKAGKNQEAIAAFEKAKGLDKTLSESADSQIAMCYLLDGSLEEAPRRFQVAVQADPRSDLASFARRYQDMVENQLELERPFRFTLGVFGQYDTDVVLRPTQTALAPDITGEGSRVRTNNFQVDYVPNLKGPLALKRPLFILQPVSRQIFDKPRRHQ